MENIASVMVVCDIRDIVTKTKDDNYQFEVNLPLFAPYTAFFRQPP